MESPVGRRRPRPAAPRPRPRGPSAPTGRPVTTTSATAGCPAMARSTSSTKIFSPPELTVTESRPSSSICAVGQVPGPVARDGVADAVDHREGARRLVGVAEIPERHAPGLGQPPVALVARLEHRGQRLVDHHGARAGQERPHLDVVDRTSTCICAPVSEEPAESEMTRLGRRSERQGPHGRGQRRAAVAHGEEGREVVGLLVELQERAGAARRRPRWSWCWPSRARRCATRRRGRRGAVSSGKTSVAPWAMSMKAGPLRRAVHERRAGSCSRSGMLSARRSVRPS